MAIPDYVKTIIAKFEKAGFEAYIVGGCVRDLLMEKKPKDWDITTNARPEQTLKVFPEGKYENEFGTVLIPAKGMEKEKSGDSQPVTEVTTYRSERGYSDRRHPDTVLFEDKLEKDLERRDFTVNAMAIGKNPGSQALNSKQIPNLKSQIPNDWCLIDLFGGSKDIKLKVIRAVGEPEDRFKEDALRMMRGIRFASQLGFSIEPKTERAIVKLAGSIKFIANERIRDELKKILESDRAYEGIALLYDTKLLQYIMPELLVGVDVKQDRHHVYTVYKHNLLSLKYCPSRDWRVRLAALLHDIGKPKTKKIINGVATFYNHEYAGERITRKILARLKFSNEDTEKTTNLVRHHMFYYNVGEVTAASVRRLIRKVGRENLKDLIDLRIADRLGSGVPKAKPYKLRHLEYMMEKVQNDPVSVRDLKLNGDRMIAELGFEPGPKMGAVLDVLLMEVIEDPALNEPEYLDRRALELKAEELAELRKKAKETIEEKREEDDRKMKEEFWVK
ncbi:MAG: HD domain-containing protein [Candidatus Falkowbacteria bacterium]